jgi:hypothetical protein
MRSGTKLRSIQNNWLSKQFDKQLEIMPDPFTALPWDIHGCVLKNPCQPGAQPALQLYQQPVKAEEGAASGPQ